MKPKPPSKSAPPSAAVLADPGRVTINDIARLANVSKKTVSRVINNSPYVGQETRARVLAIMAEHDYAPDPQARSLAFRRGPRTEPVVGAPQLGSNEITTSRSVWQNIRFLDDLLNEAIDYLDGEAALAVVDRVRRAAKAGGAGDAKLQKVFSTLTADEALLVVRALTVRSILGDIGEDVAGRQRHGEGHDDGRPRSLSTVIRQLSTAGRKEEVKTTLQRMFVAPVLTAHPTEMRRRCVVDREYEIARLLAFRRHYLPRELDKQIREELFREIAILWKTRLTRPERITVRDEIRNGLAVVGRSMLPALIELYRDWSKTIDGDFPSLLQLGSWLGGDRDGHPGVDASTLRTALSEQARLIFAFYLERLDKLQSDLAISSSLFRASDEVKQLAETSHVESIHRRDEPYRRALFAVERRARGTLKRLSGDDHPDAGDPYHGPADFIADLTTIRTSLIEGGGERLVGDAFEDLLQAARTFGFHLLALDMRQNSAVHERTLAELFQHASGVDYLKLSEEDRVKLLLNELTHERLLRSPFTAYSDETQKELAVLDAAREGVAHFGPGAFGAYCISKSESVSDMLEPLILMKQAGLAFGGPTPHTHIRVTPLFETINDLANARDIVRQWLHLPIARDVMGDPPIFEVMLGYSDSNKDGGYCASRWGLQRASADVSFVCRDENAPVQFFHGRGGSIGRGGGSAYDAIMAQPEASVHGRLRLTEQGEMIARKYGDRITARQSLDSLAAAALLATSEKTRAQRAGEHEWRAAMTRIADNSFRAYRKLVYDDPAFVDFFWSATPISEIVDLKIGSRPASRSNSKRIEDLRAIPWVFSWSQSRFMLPGWYGFASGVQAGKVSIDLMQDMVAGWDFFSTLLSNMELALAQSDMTIAEKYAALSSDEANAKRIFAAIRAEHDAACVLVLAIRGEKKLLETQHDLAESIEMGAAYVDPLNYLQLELLTRRRRGEVNVSVRHAIQLTVNGIAAGLRNTG